MSLRAASALDFSGPERPGAAGWRQRTLLDLIVGYGLILIVIWTPAPLRSVLYFVTLGWIGYTTWSSFSGWDAMGVRVAGFFRSLWVVGVALCLAAGAVVFAMRERTLHGPDSTWRLVQGFWGYTVWSFFQQFLLQDFVMRRLLKLTNDRRVAVIGAAALFALAHLPNPVLTVLTLVWGVASSLVFLRYRNLFTLGMTHAILGICVAVTLPASVQHNMRVGLGYLRYRPHGRHHLNQMDHKVSTVVWVMAEAATRRL
jgi:membrane protease YdiL (CAAX protease family)